ncbi:hypothetical protein ACQR1Y_11965 [Bradyrhizobium sp. HKCCYLRH3099]|uniref:hypothetical protein n=1 Tax=unclassified Bradyrhizobium TaxID=2631580 RepID=UPI003EBFDFBA
MQRVTDEWGDDPPSASVPIMVGEREQTFSVWLHRSKPKIMVQTTELAGTAAAGFVRGLSAGIVASNPEASPYAQAAMTHLDATRGPGCRLTMARPITRIGFEWDYDCTPPTPPRPARPKPR